MQQPPKPLYTWKRRLRTHCKRCRKRLTPTTRYEYRDKRDGRVYFHSYCKDCNGIIARAWRKKHPRLVRRVQRKADLKRFYGKTIEWFDQKLAEQGGGCGICGTTSFGSKGPCVDHDHDTTGVRGILCAKCNTALAAFESVPDWPAKAAAYLAKYVLT